MQVLLTFSAMLRRFRSLRGGLTDLYIAGRKSGFGDLWVEFARTRRVPSYAESIDVGEDVGRAVVRR